MFKQEDLLNGLDAWRQVARVIDNGIPLRLQEVRGARRGPESIATGIAEFEAKTKENREAGGLGFSSS